VLYKGASELEALAGVTGVAFDKTGTLTEGKLHPSRVLPHGVETARLLSLLLGAESASEHPVAVSLRRAYPDLASAPRTAKAERTVAGKGVTAVVEGVSVLAGNRTLLEENGVTVPALDLPDGLCVLVAADGAYIGAVSFDDTVKKESPEAVERLRCLGLDPILMLSGDRPESAARVAEACGITEARASLLPEEKLAVLTDLAAEGKRVAFVGDGINDSPALAASAAGIAMGLGGTDAAVEAADAVLLDDSPLGVPCAIAHARRARRIVWQNIVFSLGVKVAVMAFSFLSVTGMWAAVFADVGVSVVAILNATRAFKVK
jgi:Cd2+/Zn2+-exporting ATPase